MQIVIDIDEQTYNEIKDGFYDDNVRTMAIAIGNGTPLPKGHGRLIDANKVDTAIYECFYGIQFYDGTGFDIYSDSKESIDKIPTIIEADKEREE